METVGHRIRIRRKLLGLTQADLCSRAGLSPGFLSEVENGNRNLSSGNLLDVAKALSCSCDWLLTGHSNPEKDSGLTIPPSLAEFAAKNGLEFGVVVALQGMQRQILAFRTGKADSGLETVDWAKFYKAVKGQLHP
jgi:transcriptional regulator with XRE-family HTH domain